MPNYQSSDNLVDLTTANLRRPYEQSVFILQLREAGVPASSIEMMLNRKNAPELFSWLYADIEKDEARLLGGERHSGVVGVFITDGRHVLVERDPGFGSERKYAFGGQARFDEDPASAALREIGEETSLAVIPGNLILLGSIETVGAESGKLPGVKAPRCIHHFLYRVDSFKDVPGQMSGIYPRTKSADGEDHELLVLTIEVARSAEGVNVSYRMALEQYYARIISS